MLLWRSFATLAVTRRPRLGRAKKEELVLDRTLMAPYVAHILFTAKDAKEKKLFPGCGEKMVDRLVAGLGGGENLLCALETQDEARLHAKTGIKLGTVRAICQIWSENKTNIEQIFLDMLPREWKKDELKYLYEHETRFVENPYFALQSLVRGKDSFAKMKQFLQARRMGFDTLPQHEQISLRVKALLSDGFQVCLPEREICEDLKIEDVHLVESALLEQDGQSLFAKVGDYYYLSSMLQRERAVARNLALRIRAQARLPKFILDEDELQVLSPSQRASVELALQSRIFVLTGGPGTGKTFVLGKMLRCWHDQVEGERNRVVVCTPTARGANNLKRVAKAEQAMTVHRALGAVEREDGSTAFTFDQVDCQVFILDEATLVDLKMMHNILQRLSLDTVLVLMGDKDQLPSIGPGSVFRDLLKIGSKRFGVAKLSEPRRYTSELDALANAILLGKPGLGMLKGFRNKGETVHWIPIARQTAEQDVRREIKAILSSIPDKDSVQVLVKAHAKTWNAAVLKQLFTGSPRAMLEVGDRVMQLVNDSTRNVVNGEVGKIVEKGAVLRSKENVGSWEVKYCVVLFPDDKLVRYEDHDQLEELTLAYAMSVHKSQGCEFDTVILVMSGFPQWTREMFYTACTRAKKRLIILSTEWDLKHAVENLEPHRYSHLAHWFEQELAALDAPHQAATIIAATTVDLVAACETFLLDAVSSIGANSPASTSVSTPGAGQIQVDAEKKTCTCAGFRARARCIHVDML